MKCKVCAWRVCATCHNQDVRGEDAPIIPELTHPTAEDSDSVTTGQDVTHPLEEDRTRHETKNAVPVKNERAYQRGTCRTRSRSSHTK